MKEQEKVQFLNSPVSQTGLFGGRILDDLRRVENLLFHFLFYFCHWPSSQQYPKQQFKIKEQFPQSLGLKRRRVVYRASQDHFPPLSPGSGWLPKSTPPAHLWNLVRKVALKSPLQVVTRRAVTRLLCFHPHEESGECYTTHPDPAPCHHRPGHHIAAPPRVRR